VAISGGYRVDAGISPTMAKSLMYKLSYYRFAGQKSALISLTEMSPGAWCFGMACCLFASAYRVQYIHIETEYNGLYLNEI
jgi:hypothetical protein